MVIELNGNTRVLPGNVSSVIDNDKDETFNKKIYESLLMKNVFSSFRMVDSEGNPIKYEFKKMNKDGSIVLKYNFYGNDYEYNYTPAKAFSVPNGKVDENFTQGQTGDCWLLATINALSKSKKGQEILDKTVKTNSDGTVTVRLQGVEKEYRFTLNEIYAEDKLCSGDMDVRAIEMAVKKYMDENNTNFLLLNHFVGNMSSTAYKILVKDNSNVISNIFSAVGDYIFGISDSQIKDFNNPDCISVALSFFGEETPVKGGKLMNWHAYTIIGADDKNVYLENPHKTGEKITVTKEQFKDYFATVETNNIT